MFITTADARITAAVAPQNKKIFLHILSARSGKNFSANSVKMLPPSVEQRGNIVKMPIIRFTVKKSLLSAAEKNAAKTKLPAAPAARTSIFFTVLIPQLRLIDIPAAETFTSCGAVLMAAKAAKWQSS